MTAPQATEALIVCDGVRVPSALSAAHWEPRLEIWTAGPKTNVNLQVDDLASKLLGPIEPRVIDLVRIAAYCYAADQMVSRRSDDVDVHRAHWRRRLTLCLPVADLSFWTRAEVVTALSDALNFATEDTWAFGFDQRSPRDQQFTLPLKQVEDRALRGDPDSVLLFSGGSDSLCALVEAVAGQGRRPLVVSHRPTPPVDHRQRVLLQQLRHRFPQWSFPPVSAWIHRRGSGPDDSSQRARAFLFAALGAAVAGHLGVESVLLPDNGYVSINPPISAQLVGALSSRGTHPTFLRLVNRLTALVIPDGIQVTNPLANQTRAEALRGLINYGAGDLVGESRSCGKFRARPKDQPHCGECSQCVDRRFAVIAAGLEQYDPAERYGLDIFTQELPEGEARTMAVSYVAFAQATEPNRVSPDDLFLLYPELYQGLDADAPDVALAATDLADLLQRHAEEVLNVVGQMIGRHGDALARQTLPAMSLLAQAVQRERRAATDDPSKVLPSDEASERYRFARQGRRWQVFFGREHDVVLDSVGMQRLARLLKAPGQGIRALSLVTGPSAPQQRDGPTSSHEDELRDSEPGDLGEVIDDKARRQYRAKAGQLRAELAEAEAAGDEDRRFQIRANLEWIEDQLKAATGKGGKPRRERDEHENARSTVSKTVSSTIDAFAETLPGLHAHLKGTIHLGPTCRYTPDRPIPWDVTL